MHIVCPQCLVTNRLPQEKLNQQPLCGQCKQYLFNAHPIELTSQNFQKHLQQNDIPLVVDFWAAWCGPCKMMAPAFQKAALSLEPQVRLAKINTEVEQQLASLYQIRSIPTLVLFKAGKEIARISGALPEQEIIRWVRNKRID